MNTEILDIHLQKLEAEIVNNEKHIVETENLPINTILDIQARQAKLGSAWQWLSQVKASKFALQKKETPLIKMP